MDPITIAMGLATVAPKIVGWLGGDKAEAVAERVVGVARAVAGADDDALAVEAIQRDPSLALQFRQALLGHERELALVAQQDRADAREREERTGDWTPKALAFVITLGFFGVLAWMLIYGVPQSGGEALLVLLGALGTAWGAVVNYYYGSSAGSARKTDLLKGR